MRLQGRLPIIPRKAVRLCLWAVSLSIIDGMSNELKERVRLVNRRIAEAAARSGRGPGSVKLIAVTKTHPPRVVRSAIDAGLSVFGENRVQEALPKIDETACTDCEWHLIGHLQKNKARKAVRSFDMIHTVDSVQLASRLQRICVEEGRDSLPVLIQVSLAGEATKSGVAESGLMEITAAIAGLGNLELAGLMTIPPFLSDAEEVRPYFRNLRKLRDRLRKTGVFEEREGHLSMGMSHDYEAAIEEGATLVRVGTAIFGPRE